MSYQHMFYGLDLAHLQSLYGSKDYEFVDGLILLKAEELAANDGFMEELYDENVPSSEVVVRQIVNGTVNSKGNAGLHGYVLKILCDHIGEPLGFGVAAVRDHPYKSQLLASGPPLPIPYDPSDFPEIGFLALANIPAEIGRIDAAPQKAKKDWRTTLLNKVSGGMIGRQMDDEEVVEDMQAYRETLQEALEKRLSVVSFRH